MASFKEIMITGTSRGIGKSLAATALQAGHSVVGLSRSESCIEHPHYTHYCIDLAQTPTLKDMLGIIQKNHPDINTLINNAGFSQDSLMVYTSEEELKEVLSINLTASFILAQWFVNKQLSRAIPEGSILFMGSLAQYGAPSNASYAMAKGGLYGLMHHIASVYSAYNIYSNLVVLGFIETEMTKHYPDFAKRVLIQSSCVRKAGLCDEVAAGILSLATADSKALSGRCVHFSGGLIDFPIDFPG